MEAKSRGVCVVAALANRHSCYGAMCTKCKTISSRQNGLLSEARRISVTVGAAQNAVARSRLQASYHHQRERTPAATSAKGRAKSALACVISRPCSEGTPRAAHATTGASIRAGPRLVTQVGELGFVYSRRHMEGHPFCYASHCLCVRFAQVFCLLVERAELRFHKLGL